MVNSSLLFTTARRAAATTFMSQQQQQQPSASAVRVVLRRLVASATKTTAAASRPSSSRALFLPTERERQQLQPQQRVWLSIPAATNPEVDSCSNPSSSSTTTTSPTSLVLLDRHTLQHIKRDLVQVTKRGGADDDDEDDDGLIGLKELQRLFLLYPKVFTRQDAETVGDLWYVGKSSSSKTGLRVSRLAFLRGLYHLVTQQQQHNKNNNSEHVSNSNNKNHDDYDTNDKKYPSPLHLEGVPVLDACWGASRQWADQNHPEVEEEAPSPFISHRIQHQFDGYLLRYVEAAQNRANNENNRITKKNNKE